MNILYKIELWFLYRIMNAKLNDQLVRGISKDGSVRFLAVDSTKLVRKAARLHKLSITNTLIMGRMLTAALLFTADLKSKQDLITLKLETDGPINSVIVTANNIGKVKGYMSNPELETPLDEDDYDFPIKQALGDGNITIIKNLGLKQPYVGVVDLKYGTIARDLTYYFVQSEQIPTSIGLGSLIDEKGKARKSGGFMIQLLPGAEESTISTLESNLNSFPNLSDVMDMGYDIETIITDFILKGIDNEVKAKIPVKYACDCSFRKFDKGLELLGKIELEQAIEKNEEITVNCHFCNKTYVYDQERIKKILSRM